MGLSERERDRYKERETGIECGVRRATKCFQLYDKCDKKKESTQHCEQNFLINNLLKY